MGVNSGATNRRLYVDAVDEALHGGKFIPRKARAPRRRLTDIAIRHMRVVEQLQRQLKKLLVGYQTQCEACSRRAIVPPDALPGVVAASSDITNQIERLSRTIREGRKAEREEMSLLNDEQLDSVLRAQLVRIAPSVSASDRLTIAALWWGEDVAKVLERGTTEP